MKKLKQVSENSISAELEALFDKARPIDELDLKGLAQAFEELDLDPGFVADSSKGVFVEDVLRALEESNVSKSELGRRMGKSRQQINVLLDDEKKNNFTIETMAKVSTALGRKLFVRMLAPEEHIRIESKTVEQTVQRTKLRDLITKDWSLPTPGLKPSELKKAKQAVDESNASHDNIIPFGLAA